MGRGPQQALWLGEQARAAHNPAGPAIASWPAPPHAAQISLLSTNKKVRPKGSANRPKGSRRRSRTRTECGMRRTTPCGRGAWGDPHGPHVADRGVDAPLDKPAPILCTPAAAGTGCSARTCGVRLHVHSPRLRRQQGLRVTGPGQGCAHPKGVGGGVI